MTARRARVMGLGGLLLALMFEAGTFALGAQPLTLEDRIAAQKAIEEVYWSHRLWPEENPRSKPSLREVMPDVAIQARVEETLRKSAALESLWRRPITHARLQAELDRMARHSRDPRMLGELFHALHDDPQLIAETLARASLSDRLIRNAFGSDQPEQDHGARPETEIMSATATRDDFDAWWAAHRDLYDPGLALDDDGAPFTLPLLDLAPCANDTWEPTYQEVPDPRAYHTAVWTGAEMIVWGGGVNMPPLASGGRYDPATDTWTATSRGANVPEWRNRHTAVWTGTEMIVWGGDATDWPTSRVLSSGARYNPLTDSWLPTSTGPNLPSARCMHVAVWTGSQMIVWGGAGAAFTNTGGRYDPVTDTWTSMATGGNDPDPRVEATAIWTGAEMIVWGGRGPSSTYKNTGGRYNPFTDHWEATSTGLSVPAPRYLHTAVWTGSRMIVWGGSGGSGITNTGGLYDPVSDTWAPTSLGSNLPRRRSGHTSLWTGTEMIVWGGQDYIPPGPQTYLDTGARYDPVLDAWAPISAATGFTSPRDTHTAVWTGTEMIVWGGNGPVSYPAGGGQTALLSLSTGGRYDPASDRWTPTSMGATVPSARVYPSAVWTGAEMIIWGGDDLSYTGGVNTGARYDPATDTWSPTSRDASTPPAPGSYQAVWTGQEMAVWGHSYSQSQHVNQGGLYDPSRNSWRPMSQSGAPSYRTSYVDVWTGTEMLVWGGSSSVEPNPSTGGRYDPDMDRWSPTSVINAPAGRSSASSVWTGTQLIVWGGKVIINGTSVTTSTGGRYDPVTDTWTPTSTVNVPSARATGTAVWTGSQMIVWGGASLTDATGGRYDPLLDAWLPTSTGANVPVGRQMSTLVWTGKEMIVWGGNPGPYGNNRLNSGGRYDPVANTWTPTSTGADVPEARYWHAAVWTGSRMIVWGGQLELDSSSGGLYCACPSGTLVYRDRDGDGHGDPADSMPSCEGTVPPGYIADAADCDDQNASVHAGALEICNGVDDDCDGAVDTGDLCHDDDPCTADACTGGACTFTPLVTTEIDGSLSLSKSTGGAWIQWSDAPGPYNVYRGQTSTTSWTYDTHCFAADASEPVYDGDVQGEETLRYYLVSRLGACGESVLGRDSSGRPIPNASPCP